MDIGNKFLIGAAGHGKNMKIAPAVQPPWPLSPDDALLMAAWLVAIAEPWANDKFNDLLKQVQST